MVTIVALVQVDVAVAVTKSCHSSIYNEVAGAILATAASDPLKCEPIDEFIATDESACCEQCANRGIGTAFCFGYQYVSVPKSCTLLLSAFSFGSDVDPLASGKVHERLTDAPTASPTATPTDAPTDAPTNNPTIPTDAPTPSPTGFPTEYPTQVCSTGFSVVTGKPDATYKANNPIFFEVFDMFVIGNEKECCEKCADR
jgi:hypothetical protein